MRHPPRAVRLLIRRGTGDIRLVPLTLEVWAVACTLTGGAIVIGLVSNDLAGTIMRLMLFGGLTVVGVVALLLVIVRPR